MNTVNVRKEISEAILALPEETLADVLAYLKQVRQTTRQEVSLSKNLRKILTEDRELLQKLAQ